MTAAGVKHVLLTYHYEDVGDFDGYASLLTEDVAYDLPGEPPVLGRTAVVRAHSARATLHRRHELLTVVAEDDTIVVLGQVVRSDSGPSERSCDRVEFADVFTLSPHSLVRGRRRYYFAPPLDPTLLPAVHR
ncbi:hypothetical protein AQJ23_39275 [Streptomyces antibioticus]|nr:nuclear transport factor 2 family protein [Streptomyces antibioticus]KUN18779.1 hypothetical protein AQJ23_39275 [Streptomyces antibioticus]